MDDDNIINREFKISDQIKLHDNTSDSKNNLVLCFHCKRTKTNGLPCIGKCIADNEY